MKYYIHISFILFIALWLGLTICVNILHIGDTIVPIGWQLTMWGIIINFIVAFVLFMFRKD